MYAFIKGNHVQFENMKAPLGHKYEGEKLIDIILGKAEKKRQHIIVHITMVTIPYHQGLREIIPIISLIQYPMKL